MKDVKQIGTLRGTNIYVDSDATDKQIKQIAQMISSCVTTK